MKEKKSTWISLVQKHVYILCLFQYNSEMQFFILKEEHWLQELKSAYL